MHVHITLVGNQIAPVYNGIVATDPEVVELVYSNETRRVYDQLLMLFPDKVKASSSLSAVEPAEILSRAEQLAKKYVNDHVTVNIAGGTKAWTYFFGFVFGNRQNAEVVYMDQNNVLWNYGTMQSKRDFVFDMDVLLRLYGNPLDNYTSFASYTKQDEMAATKVEQLRQRNNKVFNSLTILLSNEEKNRIGSNTGIIRRDENNYIEWTKGEIDQEVHLVMTNNRGTIDEIIKSPHAKSFVFNSGWFEYKVARMLSKWEYAKEIRMNCVFPTRLNPSKKVPKNEVDIIVNTGTKLLFVECKVIVTHTTDIDKFNSVVKNYGGSGSKGILITQNKMNSLTIEKCEQNKMLHFALADAMDNAEKSLYNYLNNNLFTLNA